jgi:hypothetical protein
VGGKGEVGGAVDLGRSGVRDGDMGGGRRRRRRRRMRMREIARE